jgi:hypothetical protein
VNAVAEFVFVDAVNSKVRADEEVGHRGSMFAFEILEWALRLREGRTYVWNEGFEEAVDIMLVMTEVSVMFCFLADSRCR